MPIRLRMTCKKVRTLNRRAIEVVVEQNETTERREITTQALTSHKCNGQKSAEVYSQLTRDSAYIEQRMPVLLLLSDILSNKSHRLLILRTS